MLSRVRIMFLGVSVAALAILSFDRLAGNNRLSRYLSNRNDISIHRPTIVRDFPNPYLEPWPNVLGDHDVAEGAAETEIVTVIPPVLTSSSVTQNIDGSIEIKSADGTVLTVVDRGDSNSFIARFLRGVEEIFSIDDVGSTVIGGKLFVDGDVELDEDLEIGHFVKLSSQGDVKDIGLGGSSGRIYVTDGGTNLYFENSVGTNFKLSEDFWAREGGASPILYPASMLDDFIIGGETLATSMFSIDESLGVFLLGGDQSANPILRFEATDSDTADFGFNTNDAFYFTGGDVGIGTSLPGADLEVYSTDNADVKVTGWASSSNFLHLFSGYINNNASNDAVNGLWSYGTVPLVFATNSSEKVRITSSGNVGIGNTAPTDILHIGGDVIRIDTAKTPSSGSDTCDIGEISWDASYIYVCTATDTWERVGLNAF